MSRIVFGLPAYEGEAHLAEALESLLAQRADVAVVVVDDGSRDGTAEVAARYAAADPRVALEVASERRGMVANWRRAFDLARERHPGMELFAWASDHDVWHPRWAPTLARALDERPQAVLAYCRNVRVSGAGEELKPWAKTVGGHLRPRTAFAFDTAGVERPERRLTLASRGMSAGNMVYGLWRADALERAGVFEPVLAPDRLVLTTAAVLGEFVQVPETLWYRRFRSSVTSGRQRRALFRDDPGVRGRAPWWLSHSLALAVRFGLHGGGRPGVGRARGLALAALHLTIAGPYWVERRVAHERRIWRRRLDRAGRAPRLAAAMLGRLR